MITEEHSDTSTVIRLQPNCSATWQQCQWLLGLVAVPSLIIAGSWWFLGFWIILPFAGLELSLLTFVLHRVWHQSQCQQLVVVNQEHVHVSYGIESVEQGDKFLRDQTYLYVTKPASPMDDLRLALGSEEHQVTLGEFLNQDDRKCLHQSLKKLGLVECVDRWWEE